jgi:alpha-L-fucosidase
MDHLHTLIDIVSKNGVLLLNVSPRADGTIPRDQQEVLLEMGQWLERYGEAIFGTRPWYTFGEGPTGEPERQNPGAYQGIRYTSDDVRYTTSGSTVYALFLGKPEEGSQVLLKAFAADSIDSNLRVRAVGLAGGGEALQWQQEDRGLMIQMPVSGMSPLSTVLRIETIN